MKIFKKKIILLILVLTALGVAFFLVPQKPSFVTYIKRAEEAVQKKSYKDAILYYNKALKNYPKNEKVPEVLLSLGDIYNFSLDNPTMAEQTYNKLAKQFPHSFYSRQALEHAAEMYHKSENYEKALQFYQAIIDNFSQGGDLDELRFQAAMMALKLKRFEPARRSLMAIIEKNPDTKIADRVLYQLGNTFFTEGSYEEAIKVLKVALEKYPDSSLNIEIKFTLANAYEAQGDISKSLEIYESIRNQYPNPAIIDKKLEKLGEQAPRANTIRQ